jgi:hypothetical protein
VIKRAVTSESNGGGKEMVTKVGDAHRAPHLCIEVFG